MGCLLELFLEVFIEGMLNVVMYFYLKLAHVFIPDKEISNKKRKKIRNAITTFSCLLFISMIIGVLFLLPPSLTLNNIGKCMVFIPLSIIVLQIVLGIVVVVVKNIKR